MENEQTDDLLPTIDDRTELASVDVPQIPEDGVKDWDADAEDKEIAE